jgi:hypothetical protein
MKKNKKLIKKVFSLIGKELSELDESVLVPDMNPTKPNKTIDFNITIKNLRKDGFDLYWNHDGLEVGDKIIDNIARKIRVDNHIWFDSGFGRQGVEWNLDWSLHKI